MFTAQAHAGMALDVRRNTERERDLDREPKGWTCRMIHLRCHVTAITITDNWLPLSITLSPFTQSILASVIQLLLFPLPSFFIFLCLSINRTSFGCNSWGIAVKKKKLPKRESQAICMYKTRTWYNTEDGRTTVMANVVGTGRYL